MKINNEFNLGANEGSPQKAQNYFIIVHETANSKATGRNEATYMKRNWRNAYTTDIVGDKGVVYRVGEWGYVSWGALNANPYAPVQIELQHSLDKATFQENYKAYIELIRKACDTFGIPKTLDTSGKWTKGVKSHDWVSKNWGGDHTDPYGYLAKMGISKAQFAKDIANGLGGNAVSKPQEKITQGRSNALGGLWYRSHLSAVGWLGFVGTEETSGTTGKAIPVEAIDVRWDNQTDKISASFQDIKGKWYEWTYGVTGTTGKGLPLVKVRFDTGVDIRKTGRTLQYRVHSADVGWSDWVNQGETVGTSGKQIEAIQMRMLKDGKVEKE